MDQSYILTEIEFEALAAKEGIRSCWLFQPDASSQEEEQPAKQEGYGRHEEVETVFQLVKKGLLLVSDRGAETEAGLGQCFALIGNAEKIVTVESSVSEEQPSCVYCRKGQSALLTVPETDAAGIRLTLYRNSDDLIRDMAERYELPEFQDPEESEEVPPGEQAEKDTSFRWIEWRSRNPEPEIMGKAQMEESLLYAESRWGTELVRTAEGKREAVYYSEMEFLRMLRGMLESR